MICERAPASRAEGVRDPFGGLVDAVDHAFRLQDAVEGVAGFRQEAAPRPDEIGIGRRRIAHCGGLKRVAIVAVQHPEFCLADAHRVLQHGLEHRLGLAGR